MSAMLEELRRQLGDRYAFERLLGQGGMGAVYLARDRQLDRLVALKVLPAEVAENAALRERFLRETRLAAGFSHPNIVPVYAVEEREGILAFAMGYVEGESLAERLRRDGPLTARDAVRLLKDVAYALAYAHGRGVVHRDIKPDNIMLERATGRALVMDFGIARQMTAETAAPANLTRVGEVVGTPEFMSPEQASGDVLDGRSDLYALGLVAWFALTGRSAMHDTTTQRIMVRQLTEPVPDLGPLRPDLPPALVEVVARCCAKAPDARFPSGEAIVETIEAAELAQPDVPVPIRLFEQEAGTAGLVTVFGVVVTALLHYFLQREITYELDAILPVVLVAAIFVGRALQPLHAARALRRRGFSADEIQEGFRRLRAERDAERAARRADPAVVRARRVQILVLIAVLVWSTTAREWVLNTMRLQIRPEYYLVSRPGVIILYAASVMRGLAVLGLLRSPLRPSIGERLFAITWAGWPGRMVLRWLGPRADAAGSRTLPPTTARTTGAAPMAAAAPSPARAESPPVGAAPDLAAAVAPVEARLSDVERRLASLEARLDRPAP